MFSFKPVFLIVALVAFVSVATVVNGAEESSLEHEVFNHRKLLLAADDDGIEDQYIVKLQRGVDPEQLLKDLSRKATDYGTQTNTVDGVDLLLLDHLLFSLQELSEAVLSQLAPEVLARIIDSPEILLVEQDRNVQPDEIDEQHFAPWHLDRIDNPSGPLDWTYEYEFTGSGVEVYILDSGVREDHEEFANISVTCGYNAFQGQTGCNDRFSHGTFVASLVGGKTCGTAKNVTLIAVKVLGGDDGKHGTVSSVIRGIEYVIEQKLAKPEQPMVVNLSLGTSFSQSLNDAIDRGIDAGLIIVSSAGNEGNDACLKSPASAQGTITVGSIDESNEKSDFSNDGVCVDVFAPGSKMKGASTESPSATKLKKGTSMAASVVSGVTAMYLQRQPNLTPEELMNLIQSDAIAGLIKASSNSTATTDLIVSTEVLNQAGNLTDDEGNSTSTNSKRKKPGDKPCRKRHALGFCFFY